MKFPVLFASAAAAASAGLAAIPLGAWFSACSNGTPASPTPQPISDSGLPIDDGSTPDTGAAVDSSTPIDSGTADAGPCAPEAGTTVFAKFDFLATGASMNGGKGQVLSVNLCDSVVWQNDDPGTPHGVVSPPDAGTLFNTGTLSGTDDGGVAFPAVQFTAKGTYVYNCAVHGNMMIGQITVN